MAVKKNFFCIICLISHQSLFSSDVLEKLSKPQGDQKELLEGFDHSRQNFHKSVQFNEGNHDDSRAREFRQLGEYSLGRKYLK